MRICDLDAGDVAECLNIDKDEVNEKRLSVAMASAKSQIMSETGLNETDLNDYADLTTAYLALVQDAYDNVGMQSDGKGINQVKDCILGLHRRNLV